MFKPRIGMTFDSLTEEYQFYNIKKKKPAGKAKRSKEPGGLSGVV